MSNYEILDEIIKKLAVMKFEDASGDNKFEEAIKETIADIEFAIEDNKECYQERKEFAATALITEGYIRGLKTALGILKSRAKLDDES